MTDAPLMICPDCGKPIYDDAADESIGGKHATILVGGDDGPLTARFVCMPCSEKYENITNEVLGETYTPIGDDTKKEPEK